MGAPAMPEGFDIDQIGGNCPIQAEGSWDGREIYFRARGERWSLTVQAKPSPATRIPKMEAEEPSEAQVGAMQEEAPAQWQAWGARCGSGWLDEGEALERIALHAWVWSAAERGLEGSSGAQGSLALALRTLDAKAVSAALAAGADPSMPLEEGAPTPLCVALGIGCSLSKPIEPRRAICENPSEEQKAIQMASFYDAMASVSEDGVDVRRLQAAKALLAAGADPNARAAGWAISPIHYAALLPAGQRASLAGSMLGDVPEDTGAETFGRAAARRQRGRELARAALNPISALLLAGADPRAKCGFGDHDALDFCMQSGSWRQANMLGQGMGLDAVKRYAGGLLSHASMDKSLSWVSKSGSDSWLGSPAAAELLEQFESGQWPLGWLDEAISARPRDAEAAADIRGKAISRLESKGIAEAIDGASTALARRRPGI